MAKHWLYHNKNSPKIFETEELEQAAKDGWVDSPAKLKNKKAIIETPHVDYKGPLPFSELSDAELAQKYEQVRGKVPHPILKREHIVDSILIAQANR